MDADIKRVPQSQNVPITPKVFSTDWSAIPQMVESGIGVSILPTLFIKNRTENVKFLKLDPEKHRTLIMTCKTIDTPQDYVTDFMNIAKEMISESPIFSDYSDKM